MESEGQRRLRVFSVWDINAADTSREMPIVASDEKLALCGCLVRLSGRPCLVGALGGPMGLVGMMSRVYRGSNGECFCCEGGSRCGMRLSMRSPRRFWREGSIVRCCAEYVLACDTGHW